MVFSLNRQETQFKYGNHNNEEEHDKGNLIKAQSKAADDHKRNVTCPWTLVQSSTCTPKPRSDLANLVVLAPPLLKPKLRTVNVWWSMNYSCSHRRSSGLLLFNIFKSKQHNCLQAAPPHKSMSWFKRNKMLHEGICDRRRKTRSNTFPHILQWRRYSIRNCPNSSRRYG